MRLMNWATSSSAAQQVPPSSGLCHVRNSRTRHRLRILFEAWGGKELCLILLSTFCALLGLRGSSM